MHDHIKDSTSLLEYDFLQLERRTAKIVEGKKYDIVKIGRTVNYVAKS